MRIAVNTRMFLKNKMDGIGVFTFETLKRITQNHPEHEFIFFFDRSYHEDYIFSKNVTPIVLFPPTIVPLTWYWFFELSLPKALRKYKADIFLSTDGWVSLSTDVKTVSVIHDLNFEHHKDFSKYSHQYYYKYFFHRFAKKSIRIATVSEYTKKDIIDCYGIHPDKIDIVYNGANDRFHPVDDITKESFRNEYTQGKPFFLFVGSIHQRKNLVNLFKAFDYFREHSKGKEKLLIIGQKKRWKGSIEEAYNKMKHKQDVIFIGRLPIDKLNCAFSSSLALMYVSFFEGFGIPILEAFNAETPVITSNVTSMPEVAGDAAMLVAPKSANDIADAMMQVASIPILRQNLIEKGRLRRNDFSWDRTAELLWATIEKAIRD